MRETTNTLRSAEILERGFSRRSFGRIATLIGAGATLPFYNEFALAQRARLAVLPDLPADAVRININENPLGPCPEAADVIHSYVKEGGRYHFEQPVIMAQTAAQTEGVKENYVRVFAGSSDPLHRVILAFCSPKKSLVISDPSYEAGRAAAKFLGAKVVTIPLRKDLTHDVQAMAKADPGAGVIYICNPNNPTGTVTSKADIEWLVANKPAGSIVLVDEAYIHFSTAWEERCSDLVAKDRDLIVLRTFSKLYGLAAFRAGLALGRPDLLDKMEPAGTSIVPIAGMVGATASMKVKDLVPQRRKIVREIREDVFAFLDKHNFSYVRSETNHFLLDAKRPGPEFMKAMAQQKVLIGRTWASLPNHSRISVGSREEMEKFKSALLQVMA